MNQEDRNFMEENITNHHTIENGYMRNIDIHLLNRYELIYQTYLDKNFILTKWCGACVLDMVKRLYYYYHNLPVQNIVQESIQIEKPKRGRPRK